MAVGLTRPGSGSRRRRSRRRRNTPGHRMPCCRCSRRRSCSLSRTGSWGRTDNWFLSSWWSPVCLMSA